MALSRLASLLQPKFPPLIEEHETASNTELVLRYHERSQHDFLKFARGPETLDWDQQPNPFRSFSGVKKTSLPLPSYSNSFDSESLFQCQESSEPFSLKSISALLRYSFGLTGWKQYGPDKWAVRANPSSGNLHPTECYLIIGSSLDQLPAGLYHYNSEFHELELIKLLTCESSPVVYLVLTSVLEREAWKYGERSFRYSQLDTGHGIAAVTSSANLLGWSTSIASSLSTEFINQLLELDSFVFENVDSECSECILAITPNDNSLIGTTILEELQFHDVDATVKASALSEEKIIDWSIVWDIENLTKFQNEQSIFRPIELASRSITEADKPAIDTILSRRSAQKFEKTKSVELSQFIQIVKTFELNIQLNSVHWDQYFLPIIIVHRIQDLDSGVYTFSSKNKVLSSDQIIQFGSESIYLKKLKSGDFSKMNGALCCNQSIASDCSFSIGMLAKLENCLKDVDESAYRTLHWLAGIKAQDVYQSATAMNLSATGMGCFFDEPWQEFLSLEVQSYRMIYAVAVGHAVTDERIASFTGYHHLDSRERATI